MMRFFNGDKSTVRLGLPFDFLCKTILWHPNDGSPIGTFSKTPSATSFLICCSTSSCQCSGTVDGVCTAIGVALVST